MPQDFDGAAFDPALEPLFEGDTGRLDAAQRDLKMYLRRNWYLWKPDRPDLWATLESSEALLRSRLDEDYVRLCVDPGRGVAWTEERLQETGAPYANQTTKPRKPKLVEAVMLCSLARALHTSRMAHEASAHIDREELESQMAAMLSDCRGAKADPAGVAAEVKEHVDAQCRARRGNDYVRVDPDFPGRLEVTPAVGIVMGWDSLESSIEQWKAWAGAPATEKEVQEP